MSDIDHLGFTGWRTRFSALIAGACLALAGAAALGNQIEIAPGVSVNDADLTPNVPITEAKFKELQRLGIFSFQVKEFTKNERLSVGWGEDMIRWGIDNKALEQEWVLVPDGNRHKLLNLRNDKGHNMKYIGLQPGRGRFNPVFGITGDEGVFFFGAGWGVVSKFKMNWIGSGKTHFQMQENTKDELLTIHYDGATVRWKDQGGNQVQGEDKTQVFQLLSPRLAFKRPLKSNYRPRPSRGTAGRIPGPPRLTDRNLKGLEQPPEKSEYVLVNEQLVPATMMGLLGYADKRQQIDSSPYYLVTHYEYWDRRNLPNSGIQRGRYMQHFKGTTTDETLESYKGNVFKNYDTLKETFNVESEVSAGTDDVSASLKLSYGLEKEQGTSVEITKYEKVTFGWKNGPEQESIVQAVWSLVDRWEVREYEAIGMNNTDLDKAPTKAVIELVRQSGLKSRYPELK